MIMRLVINILSGFEGRGGVAPCGEQARHAVDARNRDALGRRCRNAKSVGFALLRKPHGVFSRLRQKARRDKDGEQNEKNATVMFRGNRLADGRLRAQGGRGKTCGDA